MTGFVVQHFQSIPKIVGRGAKPGSSAGRPPLYPFDKLANVGDGFPFPSALLKKVRGSLQQYRQAHPNKKFVLRPIDPDTSGPRHACILAEILTDEQLAAAQATKAAAKAAEREAEAKLLQSLGIVAPSGGTQTVNVPSTEDQVQSIEDVLSDL